MRQHGVFALVVLVATNSSALAQAPSSDATTYPERIVRVIVPFSAGSMTDIMARTIADKLTAQWSQQVIVENRPGLAGTASVAKSAGDGYTLMLTSNGHTVIGNLNKNIAFDPLKDFMGVTQVASTPLIMVTSPSSEYKSVQDLIEAAKAKPGSLNYSSAGLGSTTGIAGELFKQVTNTSIVNLAVRGLPETHTAVIRGDVAIGFTFFNAAGDLIQSGKIRALAVTGAKRLSGLPDIPTFKEAGVPEFEYDAWFGIMAPAGTSKAIVIKASLAIGRILEMPDVRARFEPHGMMLISSTPEKFDTVIKTDAERYSKIIKPAT